MYQLSPQNGNPAQDLIHIESSAFTFSLKNMLTTPHCVSSPYHDIACTHQGNETKEKLIDAFFHKHKNLQQLCEMAVNHITKIFPKLCHRHASHLHLGMEQGVSRFFSFGQDSLIIPAKHLLPKQWYIRI